MNQMLVEKKPSAPNKWGTLTAVIFSIIAAGSYTTLAGLISTQFIEQGWSAASISIGVGVNMAMYGITAPFAIFAMQRYGIRRVALMALTLLIFGSFVLLIPNLVIFNLSWGLLIGIGTGTLTMAYGALVARTWFPEKLGTVAGILTAAAVFGQFALLPAWAEIALLYGWRAPLIGCAVLAMIAMIANILLMKNQPLETTEKTVSFSAHAKRFMDVFPILISAMKSKPFWVLVFIFAICGATTNGLLWSHFTPATSAVGISVTVASSILFLIGVFNIVGTVSSGWLADRISPRLILSVVFFARAGTLFWLPVIIASGYNPQLITFGVLFGIMDVATVPPIILLCNRVFGDDGPAIFGWINAFHQIGAGAMALTGGLIWAEFEQYDYMWILAGGISVVASVAVFLNKYNKQQTVVLKPV